MSGNIHTHYLKQALSLAKPYLGCVAPNPPVGAVLVKNDQVLATGEHRGPGYPHAEAVAIQSAKEVENASLYVTLEPCCHWGRTPPCTDLIIRSRVKSVYFGFRDPNPRVSGQGIRQLEAAGIICHHQPLPEIDHFYRGYQYWTHHQQPWVTAKLAISLDGKIASSDNQPILLTGEPAARYTHEQRQSNDALLTSSRTIIQDNPKLNVRQGNIVQKKPIYILDSELRLPTDAAIWQTAEKIALLHGPTHRSAVESRKQQLIKKSLSAHTPLFLIEIPRDAAPHPGLHLPDILSRIAQDGVQRLWVEAGGRCFESFLHQQLLNEAFLYIAPCIVGEAATPAFQLPYSFQDTAPSIQHHLCGKDLIVQVTWKSSR